jgi:hypothetical protein
MKVSQKGGKKKTEKIERNKNHT